MVQRVNEIIKQQSDSLVTINWLNIRQTDGQEWASCAPLWYQSAQTRTALSDICFLSASLETSSFKIRCLRPHCYMRRLHPHCEISFPEVIELHSRTSEVGELQPLSTAATSSPFRPNILTGFSYDFIATPPPDPKESSFVLFYDISCRAASNKKRH
jgi:hypothetical protein